MAARPIVPAALASVFAVLSACGGAQEAAPVGAGGALPQAASTDGWVQLFDGATLAGWRGHGRADVPAAWTVRDGTLHFAPGGDGGDIVTEAAYGDFELELDWRVAPCGNSGIFYRGGEGPPRANIWQTALEMQVLDDACHPDAAYPSHRAGALYDLYVPAVQAVRPGGEWNRARIVARGPRIEHYLNGQLVVEAEMGSADWNARVAASKFRDGTTFPAFGTYRSGPIGLQDHGDRVWYRNIRIHPLS